MTQLSINTTQNVTINFTTASVGERLLAVLTDFLIQTAYFIVVLWVFFYYLGIGDLIHGWDYWSKAAIYILFFFPLMFYTLLQESIFEGQTFGKRLLKIKVVFMNNLSLNKWFHLKVEVAFPHGIRILVFRGTELYTNTSRPK